MNEWKPGSYPSVSPYLIVENAEALIEFLQAAFGALVARRFARDDGTLMHAEVWIDDSIVMIGGGATGTEHSVAHIHLYVEDASTSFRRAVAAGARIVQEPIRKSANDDVRGGVQDPTGTIWWIATQ